MRLEAEDVRAEPAALAEEDRVDQARHARADLDRPAAGVVEDTELERPALGRPDPVDDRAVDQGRPAEEEDAGGEDAASLGGGADQDGRDEGGEHVLVAARRKVQRKCEVVYDVDSTTSSSCSRRGRLRAAHIM